jgi:hypothetical protein
MQVIKLNPAEWAEVNTELAKGSAGKIPAIKIARQAKAHQIVDPQTGRVSAGVGLKEAKEAVEHYMTANGMHHPDGSLQWSGPGEPSAKLVPMQPIKRLVCDFGEGEVELDMDGMSLRVLSGLNGAMRIQDALALVDLYKRVKDWEDELCKPDSGMV